MKAASLSAKAQLGAHIRPPQIVPYGLRWQAQRDTALALAQDIPAPRGFPSRLKAPSPLRFAGAVQMFVHVCAEFRPSTVDIHEKHHRFGLARVDDRVRDIGAIARGVSRH